jgi:hypothetical protein
MVWNKAKFRLNSDAPLLMKNGQTVDPLNKFAKASKEISSKRKKTDADQLELRKIDFMGALYVDSSGAPCIPANVLEAAIIAGAKKSKQGPKAKAGMFVESLAPLEYEGPRTADELYGDGNGPFVDVSPVKVGQAKVMRCRPKFDTWSLEVDLQYDDTMCNKSEVEQWLRDAGSQCGIGDWRPRHGRFTAELVG